MGLYRGQNRIGAKSDVYDGFVGPIPWGHSGPLCHALSLLLLSSSLTWTSMRRRRAKVLACDIATPGEWRVRRLAVANGPNIFQMLLVVDASAVPGQCEPVNRNGTAATTTTARPTTTTASASAIFTRCQQATVTFASIMLGWTYIVLVFASSSTVMGNIN